ncbi:MAG TPA: beta-3-deoxy-D-manno-oct-2-ulosonic acid transferase, partial [Novosphingobium sp.]|nr:beta-3-deoxy-D-manno-oct-2-ulosonic acid transferase [Novosphingobium sp.]
QVTLPAGRTIVLAPDDAAGARMIQDLAHQRGLAGRAVLLGSFAGRHEIPVISRLLDPWHVVRQASLILAGPEGEWAPVAALAETEVEVIGEGRWSRRDLHDTRALVAGLFAPWRWQSPFSGNPLSTGEAVEMLGEWRRLIDLNRTISAVFGVARWKRVTMDALLWDGGDGPRHAHHHGRRCRILRRGDRALVWGARVPAGLAAELTGRGISVGEVEDGMIRGTGLGANCVPPLSVIADFDGIYFDPSRPSELERLLAETDFPERLVARAAALRMRLVAGGIGKYGRADPVAATGSPPGRRRVLVTGQVADDRSVLAGGQVASSANGNPNLALLCRARELEGPDAWLIYKPHPDVEAGHRTGAIEDSETLRLADEIDRSGPIAPLLESVDALHVLTSLAGFEALMRGISVTTHGVPFYAGWGLTRDLGPVPARRNRKLSLDELVAATLIMYPRYMDPVSRLPCPVEVLVHRLEQNCATVSSPLVRLRELQGRLNLLLRRGGDRK